jgi:hypothetical protein
VTSSTANQRPRHRAGYSTCTPLQLVLTCEVQAAAQAALLVLVESNNPSCLGGAVDGRVCGRLVRAVVQLHLLAVAHRAVPA